MFAVALYARAWVEINEISAILQNMPGRPLREGVGRNHSQYFSQVSLSRVALYARAWVEIVDYGTHNPTSMGRPLREGVGRNPNLLGSSAAIPSRPLREGVGRNEYAIEPYYNELTVALYARAWVEMCLKIKPANQNLVALYARAWVEI